MLHLLMPDVQVDESGRRPKRPVLTARERSRRVEVARDRWLRGRTVREIAGKRGISTWAVLRWSQEALDWPECEGLRHRSGADQKRTKTVPDSGRLTLAKRRIFLATRGHQAGKTEPVGQPFHAVEATQESQIFLYVRT